MFVNFGPDGKFAPSQKSIFKCLNGAIFFKEMFH